MKAKVKGLYGLDGISLVQGSFGLGLMFSEIYKQYNFNSPNTSDLTILSRITSSLG